jgi:23S rRNA (cytidine1920-2'-O)/16S rRNA (cytidine1409-2'-O)-methyltransferase
MKTRLDILVAEKEDISREKAQALIMAGSVLVDGEVSDKSGTNIDEGKEITVRDRFPYVSRGALKLEKAVVDFYIELEGKIVCDVGASTGGFTDYSLQHGARKVYAIDTGYGQIDQKLREDKRVILFEKTNIRKVDKLPEPIDIFVVDVSFISLTQVLPAIKRIIGKDKTEIVALIKPQFEVGKKIADKAKGIIKDEQIQLEMVEKIGKFAEEIGFKTEGITESPITGAKGNKEFLIYLKY